MKENSCHPLRVWCHLSPFCRTRGQGLSEVPLSGYCLSSTAQCCLCGSIFSSCNIAFLWTILECARSFPDTLDSLLQTEIGIAIYLGGKIYILKSSASFHTMLVCCKGGQMVSQSPCPMIPLSTPVSGLSTYTGHQTKLPLHPPSQFLSWPWKHKPLQMQSHTIN